MVEAYYRGVRIIDGIENIPAESKHKLRDLVDKYYEHISNFSRSFSSLLETFANKEEFKFISEPYMLPDNSRYPNEHNYSLLNYLFRCGKITGLLAMVCIEDKNDGTKIKDFSIGFERPEIKPLHLAHARTKKSWLKNILDRSAYLGHDHSYVHWSLVDSSDFVYSLAEELAARIIPTLRMYHGTRYTYYLP